MNETGINFVLTFFFEQKNKRTDSVCFLFLLYLFIRCVATINGVFQVIEDEYLQITM